MKHSLECLIKLLNLIVKCGESEGVKLSKSVQIKTSYPNLLYGNDFLYVVMNY